MTTATKDKAAKIVLNAGTLKDALSDVWAAVPSRGPRPILQNVRLGDGLLTATDLELRIDREIDYHGDAVLLPADRLRQILGAVPADADVTLEPGATSCRVKAARGSWTLPTEDAAEYPASDSGDLSAVARLPADQFARAIRSTSYATDTDSSRFALGAILLEVKAGNPTFVGTDGRRMTVVDAETDQAVDDRADDGDTDKPPLLIPVRAATAALAGDGDSVQVETDGKSVVFTSGTLTVSGLMVSGRFPSWRDAIPKRDNANATAVNRENLLAATRAAAIVTSEQSKGVDYTFGKSLRLTARSAEAGEATVTCEVENPGDTGTVKLDPHYVSDFLRHLDSEADPIVEVEIAGPGDAVIFKCDDVTGLVMPLAKD